MVKIAFVTTFDGADILNWSGLSYYMSKSLATDQSSLSYVGNLKRVVSWVDSIKKIKCRLFSDKDFVLDRTIAVSRHYSQQVQKRIGDSHYDCILSPGSIPVAYLNTKTPKIIYTDATFASMLDYYGGFSNLSSETIRQGHAIEKQALLNCDLAIYSSDWAAQSAINDYGANPEKVKVIPFGANLDLNVSQSEVETTIVARSTDKVRILFNGVDWERKGGSLVLLAAEKIRQSGVDIELHIVGARNLDKTTLPSYVVYHGFLNKSVAAEMQTLQRLYQDCHFLFVPSNAEAYGLVFCEANAYGMPAFAKDTGGISTIISNGKNGFALAGAEDVNVYTDLMCRYFLDREEYIKLALSSYREYQTRLNWKVAGDALQEQIRWILNKK